MNYIFLSYSHKDIERIMPVVRWLTQEHRVIYDTNIGAAREYNEEIADMIDNAKIVISFISQNYMRSSYCIDEILYARTKEIPILLVYLEETELSSGMKLRLGRFQAIDIADKNHINQILDIQEIKKCILETSKSSQSVDEQKIVSKLDMDTDLYLEDLPGNRYIKERKYWLPHEEWTFSVTAGLKKDVLTQETEVLEVKFENYGHYMITGIPQSGKSTFAQSIVYALMLKYSPSDFNFYVIDLNNYMYDCFSKAPHAGAIINDKSKRRIKYLLHFIEDALDERKQLIRSGDILQYNSIHGGRVPAILLVLDNLQAILADLSDEQAEILFRVVKEGVRYGIYLLAVGGGTGAVYSGISERRLTELVKNRICFEQKSGFDFSEYLDVRQDDLPGLIPSKWIAGSGILNIKQRTGQFKAAMPLEADNIYVREQLIEKMCDDMKMAWKGPAAKRLSDVPEELARSDFFNYNEVKEASFDRTSLPFGLYIENGKVASLDLNKLYTFLIVGKKSMQTYGCMQTILESARRKGAEIFCFDLIGREMLRIDDKRVHYGNNKTEFVNMIRESFLPQIIERKNARTEAAPIFLFIEDLKLFADMVYAENDPQNLRNFMENIFEKGQSHQIYMIAATSEQRKRSIKEGLIRDSFLNEGQGILVGDKALDQDFLDFSELPYREQGKDLGHGVGLMQGDTISGKIKIPL